MKRYVASIFVLLWGCALGIRAQTAEVTIYSHGSWASELKPVSHNAIFHGGIWESGEPILMFVDRPWKTNDRYVVLQLLAGSHTFGTGEGTSRAKALC